MLVIAIICKTIVYYTYDDLALTKCWYLSMLIFWAWNLKRLQNDKRNTIDKFCRRFGYLTIQEIALNKCTYDSLKLEIIFSARPSYVTLTLYTMVLQWTENHSMHLRYLFFFIIVYFSKYKYCYLQVWIYHQHCLMLQ